MIITIYNKRFVLPERQQCHLRQKKRKEKNGKASSSYSGTSKNAIFMYMYVLQVFTPLPATFAHKGPQEIVNDVKMFVPTAHVSCPPYTPTLKGKDATS